MVGLNRKAGVCKTLGDKERSAARSPAAVARIPKCPALQQNFQPLLDKFVTLTRCNRCKVEELEDPALPSPASGEYLGRACLSRSAGKPRCPVFHGPATHRAFRPRARSRPGHRHQGAASHPDPEGRSKPSGLAFSYPGEQSTRLSTS